MGILEAIGIGLGLGCCYAVGRGIGWLLAALISKVYCKFRRSA